MMAGLICAVILGLVSGCLAGWLNPTQQGFVIQTFTTYEPMSGNNSGTIVTNGNSFQFAGDNTGWMWIGGPGAQFRGKNDGNVYVDGEGGFENPEAGLDGVDDLNGIGAGLFLDDLFTRLTFRLWPVRTDNHRPRSGVSTNISLPHQD